MSSRDREGLIARIRQTRRIADQSTRARPSPPRPEDPDLRALEDRMTHLEQLLQGLQDSVHRESERQDARLSELEARVQAPALARALSEDARNRGL